MPEICVVHLIREKNGIAPFKSFLESYKRYSGGIEHDLLFLFKGFRFRGNISEYDKILEGIPHQKLSLPDRGYDIAPYFAAARAFEYKYFCFLNSYSVFLDKDWLRKLFHGLSLESIGAVGATGSSESHLTNLSNRPYIREILTLGHRTLYVPRIIRYLHKEVIRRVALEICGKRFDPFPNYHLRTNGFLIAREHMLKIRAGRIWTKNDAHRFESGRDSLTKQLQRMNLDVLVGGKNGYLYRKEEWNRSETYWWGEQSNLLIADNQTRRYTVANQDVKNSLAASAWGFPKSDK